MLDQRDDSRRDTMEEGGARFHHATQSNVQFKTYEFFVSGVFHLVLLDCG